jgi:hypothetical protein
MSLPPQRPFHLEPTFPIEGSEIKRRIVKAKLLHPVTVGVGAGCLALALLLGAGVGGFIGLFGIGAFALVAWWQKQGTKIEAEVIQHMIQESNQAQDRKLAEIVGAYRRRGLYHYASALGKFMLVKKRIETELHQDGALTDDKQQVDRLVDQMCAAVCRQFARLTELDRDIAASLTGGTREHLNKLEAGRSEILERIMHAYNTMYETLKQVLQTPPHPSVSTATGSATTENKDSNLNEIVTQLKEENRINRAVRERLEIHATAPGDPDYQIFGDLADESAGQYSENDLLEPE